MTQQYLIIDGFGSEIIYSAKETDKEFIIKSNCRTLVEAKIEKIKIDYSNKPRNIDEMNKLVKNNSIVSIPPMLFATDLSFIYTLLFDTFQIIRTYNNGYNNGLIHASIEKNFKYLTGRN